MKGSKRQVEGIAPNKPRPFKIYKQSGSSSLDPKDNASIVLGDDRDCEHTFPTRDDLCSRSSMWIIQTFDAKKFISSRLHFPEDFFSGYWEIRKMDPYSRLT
ncbi:unnamed protein product [Vicia faba]|uniref:Uncharacterized protein n=1 Tax=Vicia faba TaxID=3906 RepID=A0AAV1ARE2_VICFA|nr:unnamed protein product [Vicia faba]